MDCLVEIYDREQINNIFVVLSFRPKKVVVIYDAKETNAEDLILVEKACTLKIKNIKFEFVEIDSESIDDINIKCKKIIHDNPDCYFDITGGNEMFAIGAYLACTSTFTPIFKINLSECRLINIYGCKYLENILSIPKMSLDVILATHGASINGSTHPTPNAKIYNSILTFCDEIFRDVQRWKDLCFYLQMGTSNFSIEHNNLLFMAPKSISHAGGKVKIENFSLLNLAEELGFISNLNIKSKKVSFLFKNNTIKRYMTDYGTWLELYTYISIKKDPMFDDVRLSVKIDWNTKNQIFSGVINEIDITFFSGIRPVFISCKLSEPSSEALQELSMYPNYFGGRYSKCILVTLATIKNDRSYIFKRARDMKINLIDGKTIKKGKFINNIKEIVSN